MLLGQTDPVWSSVDQDLLQVILVVQNLHRGPLSPIENIAPSSRRGVEVHFDVDGISPAFVIITATLDNISWWSNLFPSAFMTEEGVTDLLNRLSVAEPGYKVTIQQGEFRWL